MLIMWWQSYKKATVLPELPLKSNAKNNAKVKIGIKTPPGMFVATDPAYFLRCKAENHASILNLQDGSAIIIMYNYGGSVPFTT